jgi:hypothetical protein
MTGKQRYKFIQQAITRRMKLLDMKGKEYSNSNDVNANFKRLAQMLGVKPYFILWIYLTKHIDSITHFIRTGNSDSEGIISRLDDARNYLDILECLLREEYSTEELRDGEYNE